MKKDHIPAYALIFGVVGFFAFLSPYGNSWDGTGTINAFPVGAASKNYRLPAEITVDKTGHGWFFRKTTYTINSAEWPNGGTMELDFCETVKPNSTTCTDQDDQEYTIEVYDEPEQPDTGDSGGYDL
jgi:hypothetical protein